MYYLITLKNESYYVGLNILVHTFNEIIEAISNFRTESELTDLISNRSK